MAGLASAIPGVGIGLDVIGGVMSFMGAQKQNEAREQMIAAQEQDVALQKKMMGLQYQRQQRQMIRSSIMARAQSKATAAAQGASQGSVAGGAAGSISGATNNNLLGLSQNLQGANEKFAIEGSMLNAYRTAASGNTLQGLGQGFTSMGNATIANQNTLLSIGSDLKSLFA